MTLGRGTYVLTKIVFLRYLGFIYLVAFLVAAQQNPVLLGEHGLTPAKPYMGRMLHQTCGGDWWPCMKALPSLFWLSEELCSDFLMRAAVLAGIVLSMAVVVLGSANVLMMGALWALYMSIVNIGQTWYGFGWESQLLETGFLAIWLCKWTEVLPRADPSWIEPASRTVVAWGYRWLLFRIMLGAGLIKIRGDQCWRDLTCMVYHYETQPVPNPLSWYVSLIQDPCGSQVITTRTVLDAAVAASLTPPLRHTFHAQVPAQYAALVAHPGDGGESYR